MYLFIVFNVKARPSSVRNCTLRSTVNGSGDWLEVECVAGFDGGMPQTFHMEVMDPVTNKVGSNNTEYLTRLRISTCNGKYNN